MCNLPSLCISLPLRLPLLNLLHPGLCLSIPTDIVLPHLSMMEIPKFTPVCCSFQWIQPLSRNLYTTTLLSFPKSLTQNPTWFSSQWLLCPCLLSGSSLLHPSSQGWCGSSSPALGSSSVDSFCHRSHDFGHATSPANSLLVCLPQSSLLSFQSDSTKCSLDKSILTSPWGLRFWRSKILTLALQTQTSSASRIFPHSQMAPPSTAICPLPHPSPSLANS